MKRRKFISAVPAAILLAQRPSAAIAQTRKKGVMLINRIGPSSSERCVAKADGHDKRMLTDSPVGGRDAALYSGEGLLIFARR